MDFYQARNSARLKKLCADEKFALVFAIDYLIGVEKTEDYVTDAQLVMICWNAWSPYKNGSFTLADTINVPLVGGPRPNPDDVLCFKNLLILNDMTNNSLNHIEPKIHLRFNFAIVESTVFFLEKNCCKFYLICRTVKHWDICQLDRTINQELKI